MSTATQSLNSVGYLAGALQRAPNRINAAARAIGIEPALMLNGIAHYSDSQAEAIAAELRCRVTKPSS